ncbi:MAG TPA: carotenoid oxygenase family protein [Aquihabitans sp.]|nr:carotenoid oxygenase family protein [Aquihabitans sp.]
MTVTDDPTASRAAAFAATGNPWLAGHFAPVGDERDDRDLEVTGSLPAGLRGAFLRNGPNPMFPPLGRYHLFDGDGMVHGLWLDGEGGARYANRWVRNAGLAAEEAAGHALFGGLSDFRLPPDEVFATVGPIKNTSNTHVIGHAGRILTMMEGVGPMELASDLSTIGPYDFDGALVGSMTAHPKLDPVTGELVFFGYSPVAPYLRVHAADADGALTWSTVVELPGPVMMHDFVVTETRVVIFDLPAVFDLHAMVAGQPGIFWAPERGCRIGVLARGAPGETVRWIDVDPFWVFHFLNAHDRPDGSIEVTGCRADRLNTSFGEDGMDEPVRPHLHRWRIDPAAGTVADEALDDRPTDFPRIDLRHEGRANRYGYSGHTAAWTEDAASFDGVIRWDLETATSEVHRYGDGQVCGETVHAPDLDDAAEGSGWLVNFVHDLAADRSSMVVLDAGTLDEVARVHLPRRVPFGFHGSWLPGEG